MGRPPVSPPPSPRAPVLLFDGVCGLCHRAVAFVLARDRRGVFRFASLQSEVGRALAARCGLRPDALDTLVLVEGERCSTRSTAALRVARRLTGAWPLLAALLVVPRPLRDAVYDAVAARRYRWFGRYDSCPLPPPALRPRFLDG